MFNFQLYPGPETRTFPYPDYELLLTICTGAKRVLEVGPGVSTYAIIEAGVEKIVSLEHDDDWFALAKDRFKNFPQVELRRYWNTPVATAELSPDETFDLAFVDSPKGFSHMVPSVKGVRVVHPGQEDCSRLNTLLLALDHAPVVLLHDAYRSVERASLARLHCIGHTFEYAKLPGNGRQPTSGLAIIKRSKEWQKADKTSSIAPSPT